MFSAGFIILPSRQFLFFLFVILPFLFLKVILGGGFKSLSGFASDFWFEKPIVLEFSV